MMKYLILVSVLMFQVACGGAQNPESSLKVGSAAPGFSVSDHNGQTVTLADLHKDGPVVVTFLRSFY